MRRTSEEVFLTGASGFIGGHVARALLSAGYSLRMLVRNGDSGGAERLRREFSGLNHWTTAGGNLLEPGRLASEMAGCRWLVHVAALYSFRPRDRAAVWDTNVRGTAGLLEAARISGVEKVVMTSSSATLEAGLDGGYHRSKGEQELVAMAAQIPVLFVLPTAPVGPGDWKPTPTGKMIVDFLKGRIFGSVSGGMNLVNVKDVARAHVLALERGDDGKRYVIAGENVSFDELWRRLALISGRRAPRLRVPHRLALFLGSLDELRCRMSDDAQPVIPLEGVRMSQHLMYADGAPARAALGYQPRSVDEALTQAVSWYRAAGYA
jgi:dihydroflavonol-4-reductase